jgi:hypothetical protein
MEWESGNIYIRANAFDQAGMQIDRDLHTFDHTTFIRRGWLLARAKLPNGTEIVEQFASPEYAEVRRLQLKYEPNKVLRPIRFADTTNEFGHPQFNVRFIEQGEPVPEGGNEIEFDPAAWHALIRKDVTHSFLMLAPTIFDCTYAHRDPQGNVVQKNIGWRAAYV